MGGDEEEKGHESHESNGCHEGHEGHEEEGSDESDESHEGHEGHEGHEEMKIKDFTVVKKGTPLLQQGQAALWSLIALSKRLSKWHQLKRWVCAHLLYSPGLLSEIIILILA